MSHTCNRIIYIYSYIFVSVHVHARVCVCVCVLLEMHSSCHRPAYIDWFHWSDQWPVWPSHLSDRGKTPWIEAGSKTQKALVSFLWDKYFMGKTCWVRLSLFQNSVKCSICCCIYYSYQFSTIIKLTSFFWRHTGNPEVFHSNILTVQREVLFCEFSCMLNIVTFFHVTFI